MAKNIIISTTFEVGRKHKVLGVVVGNTVRSRNAGSDLLAFLKNLVGGEVKNYTSMMSFTRDEAKQRMLEHAKEIGADAVVGVRFDSGSVSAGMIEVLCYGTAIKFK